MPMSLGYTGGMDEDDLSERLLLRLSPEQKDWLRAKARELDRPMAGVVRRWIDLERKAGR